MPTNDHQGDEQPPTTAAANDDETGVGSASDETEVVPPLTVATPGLAWSDADSNAEGDYTWGRTAEKASIILIIAATVAIVLGLLMWLGFYLYDQSRAKVAAGTTHPATVEPAGVHPRTTAAPVPAGEQPPSIATAMPTPTPVPATPPPVPPVIPAPALPPRGGADVFTICPDGHEGVVGGHTSCEFAANVRQVFYASGMANTFVAYSPVTGNGYQITCVGRYPAYFTDGSTKISTRCYGGDNAEVVIW